MDGSPKSFDGVFINIDEKHAKDQQLHQLLRTAQVARKKAELNSEIISAVSRLYDSIYQIDLTKNLYQEISSGSGEHHLTGHKGSAQEKLWEICETLVQKEDQPTMRKFFDLNTVASRMQNTYTIETEYCGMDGKWYEGRFIEKKRDTSGCIVNLLYVIRNVSELKQQELERERLKIAYTSAQQANKAKTTYLLNMSHDIRTPMNAIVGYNQLIKKAIHDPKLMHYQDMIDQSADLLLSIINNVLNMARIESGKMELDENYDQAGNIVSSVCDVFEEEARKKGITLCKELPQSRQGIMVDHTKIQEIFTNLIGNAVKYTPPHGKIVVSVKELPYEKAGWTLVQATVQDTGIGMSPDFLPHLFDSFSRERNTTQGKVPGTGLGIAIVKSLVDLMHGTITVESQLGKGSTFTVTIPHR